MVSKSGEFIYGVPPLHHIRTAAPTHVHRISIVAYIGPYVSKRTLINLCVDRGYRRGQLVSLNKDFLVKLLKNAGIDDLTPYEEEKNGSYRRSEVIVENLSTGEITAYQSGTMAAKAVGCGPGTINRRVKCYPDGSYLSNKFGEEFNIYMGGITTVSRMDEKYCKIQLKVDLDAKKRNSMETVGRIGSIGPPRRIVYEGTHKARKNNGEARAEEQGADGEDGGEGGQKEEGGPDNSCSGGCDSSGPRGFILPEDDETSRAQSTTGTTRATGTTCTSDSPDSTTSEEET